MYKIKSVLVLFISDKNDKNKLSHYWSVIGYPFPLFPIKGP